MTVPDVFPCPRLLSPVRQKAKSPGLFSRGGGHTKMEGAHSICDETIKQFVLPVMV